jgi:hypothetical protein
MRTLVAVFLARFKQESKNSFRYPKTDSVIPACAGMTKVFARMTLYYSRHSAEAGINW